MLLSSLKTKDLLFSIPKEVQEEMLSEGAREGSKYKIMDGTMYGRSASVWMTNLEHGRRHQPLRLMTMAENIKFSKHKEVRGIGYSYYINYDAIEVPFTDAIPSDYDGVMGVPISFLDKYCPEQFEIIGISLELANIKTYDFNGWDYSSGIVPDVEMELGEVPVREVVGM